MKSRSPGISCRVHKVIVHPGYKPAPKNLQAGDARPLMSFMAASDDIALIKLADPVAITPVPIYRATSEQGRVIEIVGRGAREMGLSGSIPTRRMRAYFATRIAGLSVPIEGGFD